MRLLIAIVLPWFAFFTIGRPFAGILCLLLQITLIGWLPAAIWAAFPPGKIRDYCEWINEAKTDATRDPSRAKA